MKKILDIEDAEKQRTLLIHLNANLRKIAKGYTTGIRLLENGDLESSITGSFDHENKSTLTTWRIVRSKEGKLLYIEATHAETGQYAIQLEAALNDFYEKTIIESFNNKKSKFTYSYFFFYVGKSLDGEYRLPGFFLSPASPPDTYLQLINGERVIQISVTVNAIDAYDAQHASSIAAMKHAARLSLIADVGLYAPQHGKRWVITQSPPQKPTSKLMELGFYGITERITEIPKRVGMQNPPGKYQGDLRDNFLKQDNYLSLPNETRKLLKAVDSRPEITGIFDKAARLYQVAKVVGRQYPSVGLTYFVGTIETLSLIEGNPSSFGEFMRVFGNLSHQEERIIADIYDSRSANVHGGVFRLGEFDPPRYFDPIMDPDIREIEMRTFQYVVLIRRAISNWLLTLI